MENKDKNQISPAAELFYRGGRCLVSGFLRLFCGFSASGESELPQGALMVVCGHEGMLDFALAAAAFKKRHLHFVSSDHYFRVPILKSFLQAIGTIPKIQFHPDPRCIVSILRTIRTGNSVCIFPSGQTSICGEPTYISPSIVRLLRKSGAPVVAVGFSGGFFTLSRFGAPHFNRSRCHAQLKLLFTTEQMKSLSDDEIYNGLCQAISFNDYQWQQRTGVQFKNGRRASGYAKLLYLCPKCGAKFTISTKGNDIFCCDCGIIATVGTDMHLHGEGVPPTLIDWQRLQELEFLSSLKSGQDGLHFNAKVYTYNGKKFFERGCGLVSVTQAGIAYNGSLGAEDSSLFVGFDTLSGLSTTLGSYFEIYFPQLGAVRFYPENPCEVSRVVIAQKHFGPRISSI